MRQVRRRNRCGAEPHGHQRRSPSNSALQSSSPLRRYLLSWTLLLATSLGMFLLLTGHRERDVTRDGAGVYLSGTSVEIGNLPSVPDDPSTDSDGDGLPDALEATLAARYAPIVILAPDERNRPASIGWLLARVQTLPGNEFGDSVRAGSSDPRDWVTYVHVFPRLDGRISVQYWFFYPFNDGPLWFDHEGDWEHVTVDVDREGGAVDVSFAQHADNNPGVTRPWFDVNKAGEHPVVLSALGSHASYPDQPGVRWFERTSGCTDVSTHRSDLAHLGKRVDWSTWANVGTPSVRPPPSVSRRTMGQPRPFSVVATSTSGPDVPARLSGCRPERLSFSASANHGSGFDY